MKTIIMDGQVIEIGPRPLRRPVQPQPAPESKKSSTPDMPQPQRKPKGSAPTPKTNWVPRPLRRPRHNPIPAVNDAFVPGRVVGVTHKGSSVHVTSADKNASYVTSVRIAPIPKNKVEEAAKALAKRYGAKEVNIIPTERGYDFIFPHNGKAIRASMPANAMVVKSKGNKPQPQPPKSPLDRGLSGDAFKRQVAIEANRWNARAAPEIAKNAVKAMEYFDVDIDGKDAWEYEEMGRDNELMKAIAYLTLAKQTPIQVKDKNTSINIYRRTPLGLDVSASALPPKVFKKYEELKREKGEKWLEGYYAYWATKDLSPAEVAAAAAGDAFIGWIPHMKKHHIRASDWGPEYKKAILGGKLAGTLLLIPVSEGVGALTGAALGSRAGLAAYRFGSKVPRVLRSAWQAASKFRPVAVVGRTVSRIGVPVVHVVEEVGPHRLMWGAMGALTAYDVKRAREHGETWGEIGIRAFRDLATGYGFERGFASAFKGSALSLELMKGRIGKDFAIHDLPYRKIKTPRAEVYHLQKFKTSKTVVGSDIHEGLTARRYLEGYVRGTDDLTKVIGKQHIEFSKVITPGKDEAMLYSTIATDNGIKILGPAYDEELALVKLTPRQNIKPGWPNEFKLAYPESPNMFRKVSSRISLRKGPNVVSEYAAKQATRSYPRSFEYWTRYLPRGPAKTVVRDANTFRRFAAPDYQKGWVYGFRTVDDEARVALKLKTPSEKLKNFLSTGRKRFDSPYSIIDETTPIKRIRSRFSKLKTKIGRSRRISGTTKAADKTDDALRKLPKTATKTDDMVKTVEKSESINFNELDEILKKDKKPTGVVNKGASQSVVLVEPKTADLIEDIVRKGTTTSPRVRLIKNAMKESVLENPFSIGVPFVASTTPGTAVSAKGEPATGEFVISPLSKASGQSVNSGNGLVAIIPEPTIQFVKTTPGTAVSAKEDEVGKIITTPVQTTGTVQGVDVQYATPVDTTTEGQYREVTLVYPAPVTTGPSVTVPAPTSPMPPTPHPPLTPIPIPPGKNVPPIPMVPTGGALGVGPAPSPGEWGVWVGYDPLITPAPQHAPPSSKDTVIKDPAEAYYLYLLAMGFAPKEAMAIVQRLLRRRGLNARIEWTTSNGRGQKVIKTKMPSMLSQRLI